MNSAKSAAFLPKLFRWIFTILMVCTAIGAIAVAGVMIADPSLPSDAHFGPHKGDVFGQPAEFTLDPATGGKTEPTFRATAFNGVLTVVVEQTAGLIELLKRYGLPIVLINILSLTLLFELLRRLFRNVGRGESFTPQSVHLVQIIGVAMIVFSLVSGVAETWFAHAAWDYFAQHTQIAVSGTPLQLPVAPDHPRWFGLRLDSWFFAGLLVLALAEVFRQGLALKRDADLTV
jgi:hypothetical protein